MRSLPQSDTWAGTDDTVVTPHVTKPSNDVIIDICTKLREIMDTYLALGYITSIIHRLSHKTSKAFSCNQYTFLRFLFLSYIISLNIRHHVCSVGSVSDASQSTYRGDPETKPYSLHKTPRNMEEQGVIAEFDIICRHHHCGHHMASLHTHNPTTHPKAPTDHAPQHART